MTNPPLPSPPVAEAPHCQLLVDAIADYAICMLDPGGHVVTWNPGARRCTGHAADEIVGRHFSCLFTPADRAAGIPEHILRVSATEGRYEGEGPRVRKDGGEIWTHLVCNPIHGPDGALLGFAEIARDITERHATERTRFASEEHFRLLIQSVRDYAIFMLDPEGNITSWNAGAETIKGYRADEVIGTHFSRFYTAEDQAQGEPAYALATALREGRYEHESERVRKDGTRFWANIVIDPIHDAQGRVIGFAKIIRDITERYHAQEELEAARTALFQSQKLQALGELTGGIAHDFNNLITVIRGSAELLLNEGLPDDKRRLYARAITETADRAATLTSRLLAFGRRQALKPEVIDPGVRLDAFCEVLSRTLGSRIEVELNTAPDLWPLEVDAAELETALFNAAFNARDAMPDGGRLTLSARNLVQEDNVCITLADTGQGIPPEILPRVFEPFFTTKLVGKGTGLGLSQIHGFAAQTGGRAEIASLPGKGTVLSLILPRAHGAAVAMPEPVPALQASWEHLSVLVVEDNGSVRQFARALMERLRATVTEATTAEEALALLQERRFDLVFSDIVMPGMGGLEFARRLRAERPDQPILLATGYSNEVTNGEAAGFQIVQKPYGAHALIDAISRALAL